MTVLSQWAVMNQILLDFGTDTRGGILLLSEERVSLGEACDHTIWCLFT